MAVLENAYIYTVGYPGSNVCVVLTERDDKLAIEKLREACNQEESIITLEEYDYISLYQARGGTFHAYALYAWSAGHGATQERISINEI